MLQRELEENHSLQEGAPSFNLEDRMPVLRAAKGGPGLSPPVLGSDMFDLRCLLSLRTPPPHTFKEQQMETNIGASQQQGKLPTVSMRVLQLDQVKSVKPAETSKATSSRNSSWSQTQPPTPTPCPPSYFKTHSMLALLSGRLQSRHLVAIDENRHLDQTRPVRLVISQCRLFVVHQHDPHLQ